MADLPTLLSVLRGLRSGSSRVQAVRTFQSLVWSSTQLTDDAAGERLLRDLAYDLDFYEPDVGRRREDPSYFGDERLCEEVSRVLRHFDG